MEIKGSYVFYEDGIEICRQENLLTKFGKRFLTNYLAGSLGFTNKSIVIGIGSDEPTVDDTRLNFEFYKTPVDMTSPNINTDPITGLTTYSVIYKSVLPNDVVGVIREVGLFPSQITSKTDYSDRYISSFENALPWIDSSGNNPNLVTTPSPRLGSYLFEIVTPTVTAPATYSTKEYWFNANFDLSGYSIYDSLTLAFRQADTNLDYIYIRFYSGDTDYFETRILGDTSITSPQSPNKIKSKYLSELLGSSYKSGTPDANSINKILVGTKSKTISGTTVYMDGLKINDEDSFDPVYGLISRSVLSSPGITKVAGKQLDIEYQLGISF
jgi:hypothetical protein